VRLILLTLAIALCIKRGARTQACGISNVCLNLCWSVLYLVCISSLPLFLVSGDSSTQPNWVGLLPKGRDRVQYVEFSFWNKNGMMINAKKVNTCIYIYTNVINCGILFVFCLALAFLGTIFTQTFFSQILVKISSSSKLVHKDHASYMYWKL
jgi:hypothetical protein